VVRVGLAYAANVFIALQLAALDREAGRGPQRHLLPRLALLVVTLLATMGAGALWYRADTAHIEAAEAAEAARRAAWRSAAFAAPASPVAAAAAAASSVRRDAPEGVTDGPGRVVAATSSADPLVTAGATSP
jgi:hypothetical protein